MRVPDEIRKTVGFVAYIDQTSGESVPVGSFFFFGHDANDGQKFSPKMYVVTARHVIEKLRQRGVLAVELRLNTKGGANQFVTKSVPIGDWYFHPSDASIDVAVFEMGIPVDADHLVIPFSMSANSDKLKQHEVELGDEVFVSGLFRHHYGKKRNIPIVRVGTLAALNEEKIATEIGEMDAYLIEARSIGGLSGSPVFLNLGVVRFIGGQVKHAKDPVFFLLGLIHGHFDVKSTAGVSSPESVSVATSESINSGIAIVVPIESVRAVIAAYESRA